MRGARCFGVLLLAQALIAAAPAPLSPGMLAPSFARSDLSGHRVDLKAYRGKLVLLDFWASWCAPCIVEIPRLIALQKRYGGVQVIGVSMDDSIAPVQKVTRRFAFNYPVLLGDADFGNLYGGVYGLPVRFLIAPDGRILRIWKGELPPGTLDHAVRAALGRLNR